MALFVELVRHVASLARLTLTSEEEERLGAELSNILSAMDELRSLDTSQVEPTSHANPTEGALREDQVFPSLPAERAVAGAPAKAGTQFVVPRVVE